MSTILVYDYDFFTYSRVIPNLECAKYAAYRKKKKDIVVFHKDFQPSMYTKTYFRKDYDDGIYSKEILNPSIEYGGRAFSEKYQPNTMEFEQILPDFEIYQKYKLMYGAAKHPQEEIRTILNATHVRASLDERTLAPFPYDRLRPRHPSVIFHDYNLTAVPNSFELIEDITRQRPSGLPYRIGNKFPFNIYTPEDLKKWIHLPPMGTCFFLQYNGIIDDELLVELCEKPVLGMRQMMYNFTYGCSDENDFIQNVLPIIYKQMLFLRSHKQQILLNIDSGFYKTPELYNLMKLISCFYGKTSALQYIQPHRQTLYEYCAWKRWAYIETLPWMHFSVTQQQMRESFQFMRKVNYEVFDMFYSIPNVILVGGKLVNEWQRNSDKN